MNDKWISLEKELNDWWSQFMQKVVQRITWEMVDRNYICGDWPQTDYVRTDDQEC